MNKPEKFPKFFPKNLKILALPTGFSTNPPPFDDA